MLIHYLIVPVGLYGTNEIRFRGTFLALMQNWRGQIALAKQDCFGMFGFLIH